MKHAHFRDVKKNVVESFGSKKTFVQWWTNKDDSPHFMMRRFEIGPHGFIGKHQHLEEHQMFVLKGPIVLLDHNDVEKVIETGEFVYMPPEEIHGYKNPNDYMISFICCMPNLKNANK